MKRSLPVVLYIYLCVNQRRLEINVSFHVQGDKNTGIEISRY